MIDRGSQKMLLIIIFNYQRLSQVVTFNAVNKNERLMLEVKTC